ncbi:phage tail tape measure protein [Enterobacteriaceae bacterium DFI.7.85]|nr:phage tail tape measure protein [Enterobacteriaceae bacterium DFI.7.85]
MSDRNLRLQVVLNAVDKLTRPFKDARAGSQELAAAIKKTRDALKQLDQAGAKLDGFRALQQSVKQTGADLAQARLRAQMMTREMAGMENPTKKQTKALEDQWRAVSRLEKKQQEETAQLSRVRAELYRLGISAKDGTGATEKIRRETARYNDELREQEARLKRVGEQQRRANAASSTLQRSRALRNEIATTGAGMIATGVATAMPLMAPVRAYSESEEAATQLAASMMAPGAKVLPEYEQINKLALQLGDRLPGTTADFQNMMTMLRRQGMSATSILNGLGEATAYLGVQLKLPATEAAEFSAKLQDATGTAEKDMMGLMDVIQKGFYAGVDPNNMLNGYAKISSAMSILKVKGLDAAKAFAPLLVMADQAGMPGESAGNAYRKVFQAAMNRDKVTGANDDLKAAGYKIKLSFSDGKGEFAGLEALYQQLLKLKNVSTEMRLATLKGIFGDDAETLQVLNIMIDKGMDGYREAEGKLQAQASLRERVDSQLKTLGNRWEAATGSFTNALATIGATVAPELKQLADWLGNLANRLNQFVQQHPKLTSSIFKVVAGFAIITATLGTLGLAVAAILGPLAIMRYGFSLLGGGALSRLLPGFGGLAAIITRLAPGLAGAGGGIRAFLASLQNTDAASVIERIREALSGFGEDDEEGGILDALRNGVLNHLKEQAENAGGALVSAFRNPVATLSTLRGHVAGLATAGFGALGTAVSRFGNILLALVTSPLALLRTALMATGGLLGALLSPVGLVIMALSAVALVVWKYWQPITAFLSGMVEGFQAAAGPVKEAFEPLRPVFTWIEQTVKGLWKSFTDLLSPVKFTSDELSNAADMGKRFGQALADGLALVMSPLESLKSGVSYLLDLMGIVSDESKKMPDARQVTGNNYLNYGSNEPKTFSGSGYNVRMYDSGGYLPAGKMGIVGENGPELINGPVNIMSRRRTAALAAATAMAFGSLSQPVAAKPLHPLSLPVAEYLQPSAGLRGGDVSVSSGPVKYEINIHQASGQSAQDVVSEVMRQLDARERQRAAGRRSSFSDRGDF